MRFWVCVSCLLVCVRVCSAVIAATLVLMLLIYASLKKGFGNAIHPAVAGRQSGITRALEVPSCFHTAAKRQLVQDKIAILSEPLPGLACAEPTEATQNATGRAPG